VTIRIITKPTIHNNSIATILNVTQHTNSNAALKNMMHHGLYMPGLVLYCNKLVSISEAAIMAPESTSSSSSVVVVVVVVEVEVVVVVVVLSAGSVGPSVGSSTFTPQM
jgi:hypothetical protein